MNSFLRRGALIDDGHYRELPVAILVQQDVKRTLLNMALPMLAGTVAMNAYNLTDTWFVSRLGTVPLAAMGFTFPVVMLLTFVAAGVGTGVTLLVSHALGRHEHDAAAGFTTHGMALIVGVSVIISAAGYLSMDAVFTRLGADSATLPLVREYMGIWYFGALTMAMPMVGNGILISTGDSRAASRLMMLGMVLNTVLDPIMIFGYLGFPAMGISGAALATVISQAVSAVWLFHLLHRKHRLISAAHLNPGGLPASCRRIFKLGVPSMLSMALMPVSATVLTRLVSAFGNEAVAACGAAGRIEMFAFVIPMSLGISLAPFVSQNFGAGRFDRIHEAIRVSTRFALLYGGAIAIVFFVGAPWLAAIFSRDPAVRTILVAYIRIICFGYGMMETHRYCTITLTGLHKPVSSALLNGIRVLALLIPLSYLGAHLLGIRGIFAGRLLTDLIVGTIGLIWVRRACKSAQMNVSAAAVAPADAAEPVK